VAEHILETVMAQHHFETHEPVDLLVEVGKGRVEIIAADTTESRVEIAGRDADQVEVDQSGRQISVVSPRQRAGFFGGDSRLYVSITVPLGSDLFVKTGSADVSVDGTVGTTRIKTGSGDVRTADISGPALVETGSGDIEIEVANAELRVKSGSGGVRVRHAESAVATSTGSGDVEIGTTNGPAAVKTGSGDLKVVDANTDVSLVTGSGDLRVGTAHRGRFTMKGASGDVHIGIPAGLPVWTDVSTISGSIRSNLESAGEPADGADHVELRAKTVSGDIVLTQV
jgi:DUF4097 and DUF4098 domain-containing protein YvlB